MKESKRKNTDNIIYTNIPAIKELLNELNDSLVLGLLYSNNTALLNTNRIMRQIDLIFKDYKSKIKAKRNEIREAKSNNF